MIDIKGLSGNLDVDKQILAQLNDRDLVNICKSNKYLNSICQSNDFWRIRSLILIKDTIPYKTEKSLTFTEKSLTFTEKSWKQHYIDFSIKITENELIKNAKNGKINVIRYLIDKKIDPSANNNEAIILASKYGRLNVVKYLMSQYPKYNIDPTASDNDAFSFASSNGHLEVVKYLMSLTDVNGENIINPADR
ncbi:unnamed protein product, partial [marine sediment metagenome]